MPSSNDRNSKTLRGTKTPGATRFHRLAMREGGLTRDEALARVQKFIQILKPQYVEWLRADLEKLTSMSGEIESSAPDSAGWASFYKQSCVIRDLGSTFGYHAVTEVADSLCELIKRLEATGNHHPPAIEAHLRALQLVGTDETDALGASVDNRLIEGLRAVVDMFPKAGEK